MKPFAQRYSSGRKRFGVLALGLGARARLVQRHLRPGTRALDLGAADGRMFTHLSRLMDFSLTVSLEKDPALAALIPHNGVCGSGLALPFHAEAFDSVVCSATRKHVKDSLSLLKEAARVLRPGGEVIVVDPHPWLVRLGRLLGKFDPRYLHHLSFAGEIAAELQAAGLQAVFRSNGLFVLCVGRKGLPDPRATKNSS